MIQDTYQFHTETPKDGGRSITREPVLTYNNDRTKDTLVFGITKNEEEIRNTQTAVVTTGTAALTLYVIGDSNIGYETAVTIYRFLEKLAPVTGNY